MKKVKRAISDRPEFTSKQVQVQKEIYKDLSIFIANSFKSEINFQNKLYTKHIDADIISTFYERFYLSLPRYLFDKYFMSNQGALSSQDSVDRMFVYRQIDLQYIPMDLIKSFDVAWDIKNDVDFVATAKINNTTYSNIEQKTKKEDLEHTL